MVLNLFICFFSLEVIGPLSVSRAFGAVIQWEGEWGVVEEELVV